MGFYDRDLISLVFEPKEPGLMDRPPLDATLSFSMAGGAIFAVVELYKWAFERP